MAQGVKRLRKYLSDRNLRCTAQREVIVRQVLALNEHFDADDLHERLRGKGRGVSRATVYRTLQHLQKCGLIREVLRCEGRAKYEQTVGHHDHMVCVRCGRIVEFRDEQIEELVTKLCERRGFKPSEHRLGVKGVCSECQEGARAGEGQNGNND